MSDLVPLVLSELLDGVDAFLVRQEVEMLEAISGIESANSYIVLGATQSQARCRMVAVEQSGMLSRMVLGNKRPFTLRLVKAGLRDVNATGRSGMMGASVDRRLHDEPAVLLVERPWRCLYQEVRVKSGSGALLGTVHREVC